MGVFISILLVGLLGSPDIPVGCQPDSGWVKGENRNPAKGIQAQVFVHDPWFGLLLITRGPKEGFIPGMTVEIYRPERDKKGRRTGRLRKLGAGIVEKYPFQTQTLTNILVTVGDIREMQVGDVAVGYPKPSSGPKKP